MGNYGSTRTDNGGWLGMLKGGPSNIFMYFRIYLALYLHCKRGGSVPRALDRARREIKCNQRVGNNFCAMRPS